MERKGNELFLLELIKDIGRPSEEYARNTIISLASVDYFFFKRVLEGLGLEKAQRLYEKVCFTERLKTFRDLKMGLGVLKIEDISTLGKVARHYFDSRYCPLKPVEDTNDRFVGIVLVCPYVTYSCELFGEKLGSPYHELLGRTCRSFLLQLLVEGEMETGAEAKIENAICRNDEFCKVLIQKKAVFSSRPER